nr:CBO0543 family protein [Geobacillus kaustophilus]
MEQWILWLLAAVGIGLLGLSFRFLSPREVWLSFLLNAYISSLTGLIVSGAGMLAYPVRLFPDYTNDSVFFEYLLLSCCQCVRLRDIAPLGLERDIDAVRRLYGGDDGGRDPVGAAHRPDRIPYAEVGIFIRLHVCRDARGSGDGGTAAERKRVSWHVYFS